MRAPRPGRSRPPPPTHEGTIAVEHHLDAELAEAGDEGHRVVAVGDVGEQGLAVGERGDDEGPVGDALRPRHVDDDSAESCELGDRRVVPVLDRAAAR